MDLTDHHLELGTFGRASLKRGSPTSATTGAEGNLKLRLPGGVELESNPAGLPLDSHFVSLITPET